MHIQVKFYTCANSQQRLSHYDVIQMDYIGKGYIKKS